MLTVQESHNFNVNLLGIYKQNDNNSVSAMDDPAVGVEFIVDITWAVKMLYK